MPLSMKRTAGYGDHRQAHLTAEGLIHAHMLVGELIYVGTHGVDDVGVTTAWRVRAGVALPPESINDYSADSFANDAAYTGLPFINPDTPGTPWVPYLGAWTNGDPILEPVCFWVGAGHLHIAGLPSGGTGGLADPLFQLPEAYRPFQQVPIVLPSDSAGVVANGVIGTDGTVTIIG